MTSKFVHVDEPIALAMTLIPNSDSMQKAIARQWAYMGLRDIGPGEHWFDEAILYPNDNLVMKKPADMYKPMDIALYDSAGMELKSSYKGRGSRIHAGNIAVQNGIYAPTLGSAIDLSEDAYAFYLGTNGIDVASAKVKYLKLPIGDDGLPLIPEGQVLAIAFFIRWMWSIKTNVANDRQLSEIDWKKARIEARNAMKMPNGIEMEQVAKEWVSLLNAPQFKQF